MDLFFTQTQDILVRTNWKRTSLSSVVSGGLLLVLTPFCVQYDYRGLDLILILLAIFVVSQLACWFGGLFRATIGAICIVLSLAGFGSLLLEMLNGDLLAASENGPEAFVAALFWLAFSSFPLLLRKEFFQGSSVSTSLEETRL
mgnify:CR=1 FL=1